MRREWLEDYEAKEKEAAAKLFGEALDRLDKGGKVSPLDFYKELGLEGKKPYASWVIEHPLWVQLPYYRNIIVPLEPLVDKDKFFKAYGVTVERFLGLAEKGRITSVLAIDPTNYECLDYLNPILEKRPPTPCRDTGFHTVLASRKIEALGIEAEAFSRELVPRLDWLEEFHKTIGFSGDPKEIARGRVFSAYLMLCCLPYAHVARHVRDVLSLHPDTADAAYSALVSYHYFLAGPYVDALDGIHASSREMVKAAEWLRLRPGRPFAEVSGRRYARFFPVDVGRLLAEKLLLAPVKDVDAAEDIYPKYEKAHKALIELDNYVTQREKYGFHREEFLSRAEILENIWNETTKSLPSFTKDMERARRMFEEGVVFGSVAVGALGSLAARLPPEQSILAVILSKYLGDVIKRKALKVAPQAAKVATRLAKRSHITAIHDVVDSWPAAKKLIYGEQTT